MARQIRLKLYHTAVVGGNFSTLRLWDKNIRTYTQQDYFYELDLYERSNYYQYLDQYIDSNNDQINVWTGSDNGYYPEIITTDQETPNLVDAGQYDLQIDEPSVIVASSGANGYLKVRVSGGYWEDYEYSLIPLAGGTTVTNQTGIFKNLAAGDYNLRVVDLGDPSNVGTSPVDQTITIPQATQYATRYTNRFFTINGDSCTVNIMRKGYSGDPEEICLAGDPLSISTDVIGDDFVSGSVPMDITLVVLQDYDGQYDDMFTMEADDWIVFITIGNYFTGYGTFMMEQTSVEHQANPIHLSMNFVGGLSNMGDTKIEGWSGAILLIDVIAAIQNKYNILKYPIREFVHLKEYTDPNSSMYATLGSYKVNAAMFNGSSPKEVVEKIVKNFGCSLYLSSDGWLHIQRTSLMRKVGQTIVGMEYDIGASPLSQGSMDIKPLLIKKSDGSDGFYIEGGQGYGRIPKVGKLSVNCDFESVADFTMSMDKDRYYVAPWFGQLRDDIDPEYLTLQGAYIEEKLRWHKYRAHCTSGSLRLHGQGMKVEVTMDYMISADDPATKSELIGESIQYLLMYGSDTCVNEEGKLDRNIGHLIGLENSKLDEWEDLKKEAILNYEGDLPAPPNILKMWIYGIWNSYTKQFEDGAQANRLNFKNVKMSILLPDDHDELNQPLSIDLNNNGIDIGEVKMDIDDAPYHIGYSVEIGGVIVKPNLSLTQNWVEEEGQNGNKLRTMIALDIIKLRSRNLKRLEGSINTKYPAIGEILYDPSLAAGYFMLQHFTYVVKSNKLEFTAIEMDPSDGYRLLEDGSFRLNEDSTKRKLQ